MNRSRTVQYNLLGLFLKYDLVEGFIPTSECFCEVQKKKS